MDIFQPLAEPPTLIWRKAPTLADNLRDRYYSWRQRIDSHPYFFNGLVTAALAWQDDCLIVAPIDYAMSRLIDEGVVSGMRVLGVRSLVINDQRELLWPRRGPKTIFDNYWEPGAGGALDQANVEKAARIELEEELNIKVNELAPGSFRFEGVGQSDSLVRMIWSVRTNHFTANPDEVSEAIWLAPGRRPEPILPHYGPAMLQAFEDIARREG